MDAQDLLPAAPVWGLHHDPPVEAPGAQERLVQDLGLVGRRQHDHALPAGEPVHLGEDLVEGLLLLAVAAGYGGPPACPADCVELVHEHDCRRALAGLPEQVPDAARANAHDHLHELGRAQGEERHTRLPGDGLREQRLARAGAPDEQHALRRRAAEAGVLLGGLQEVHDLDQLVLGLVYAGDVLEGDARPVFLVVAPRVAPAQPERPAEAAHTSQSSAGAILGLPSRAAQEPD